MSTRLTLAKTIDTTALNKEISALGLPNFKGVSVLRRDVDADGRAILVNGKPITVPPYLFIRADPLTGPQIASVQVVITNHVIPPRVPTRNETMVIEINAAATLADLKVALLKRFV